MDSLTLDLIATLLASVVAIAGTGFAVWVLPWSESDWEPRARPASARPGPPPGHDPAARAAHASVAP